MTIHLLYELRDEVTACCGRRLAELPGRDQLTNDPQLTTCTPQPIALICSRGPVSEADVEQVKAFANWLRTQPPKPQGSA